MKKLIFIDTNILLDFYRARGPNSLDLLTHLQTKLRLFISTAQVEMEFLKNRQRVISESINNFTVPNFNDWKSPAFLRLESLDEKLADIKDRFKQHGDNVKERLNSLLCDTDAIDPVMGSVRDLFDKNLTNYLSETHPAYKKINKKAYDRWLLNKPPRKSNDNSIGDAINWEWIVFCAQRKDSDVVIVTRDTDYGLIQSKRSFPNDWLRKEFMNRVGNSRELILTPLLSSAFEICGIPTESRERKEEVERFKADMNEVMASLKTREEKVIRMRTGYSSKDDIYGALRLLNFVFNLDRDKQDS